MKQSVVVSDLCMFTFYLPTVAYFSYSQSQALQVIYLGSKYKNVVRTTERELKLNYTHMVEHFEEFGTRLVYSTDDGSSSLCERFE